MRSCIAHVLLPCNHNVTDGPAIYVAVGAGATPMLHTDCVINKFYYYILQKTLRNNYATTFSYIECNFISFVNAVL